jgi:predicted dehydrogenase
MSAGEFHIFEAGLGEAKFNGTKRIITGPNHPYFNDVAAMPGAGVGTGYAEAFVAEIQEFLVAVNTNTPMSTGFGEAHQMMKVVDAALASSEGSKPVKL